MRRTTSGRQISKERRSLFCLGPLLFYCSILYGCCYRTSFHFLVSALVGLPRIYYVHHEKPFHTTSLFIVRQMHRPLRRDRKHASLCLATRSSQDGDKNFQKLDLHENATISELESHSNTSHNQIISSSRRKQLSDHDTKALEEEALHVAAAPLTLSDPAFDLGVGQRKTNVTESPTKNSAAKKNKTASKSFTFPSSLLGSKTFFSTNQIKLLPEMVVAPSKTNTTSTMPVFNMTSLHLLPNDVTSMLLPNLVNTTNNNNASAASYSNNVTTTSSSLYDPLSFWNEQTTNYTKQQMDRFWEYSVNASRQLEEAQKALLGSYKAMGIMPASPSPYNIGGGNNNYNNRNNKMLSIEELDAYLRLNGYVKQEDLGTAGSNYYGNTGMPQEVPIISMGLPVSQFGRGRGRALQGKKDIFGFQAVGSLGPSTKDILGDGVASSSVLTTETNNKGRPTGRVAFPQPSIMSYSKLKWGSAVAASFLGLIGGITISPNLWLLGVIFGGLYGYETTKNLAERPPSNALSNLIVYMGRELTKVYLKIFDFGSGIWFMYKTGQLSYEYWQKYAALDQQFAIQSKIDAWNARFLKGKENFDKWEQENEVGRKMLAGLRTIWLVEENAFKKSARRKKSRYRVVQWFYDGSRYVRKKVHKIYSGRGQFWKGVQELAEGMRQELADPSQWQSSMRPRIVAALAALTFVNLTGTLFSVSPALLGVVAAVLGGIVWPTWFSDWLGRIGTFFEETKAKGRGEELGQLIRKTLPGSGAKSNSMVPIGRQGPTYPRPNKTVSRTPFGRQKNKELYNFYRRSDGSKRWYRAGRSPWDVKSSLSNIFGEQKQEDEKPWWSLN